MFTMNVFIVSLVIYHSVHFTYILAERA